MAFDLSFGPSFFLAEGEPYDRTDHATNKAGKPVSLWSAIGMRLESDAGFRADCLELVDWKADFDCPTDILTQDLFDRATEVNTCDQLASPVGVYLDRAGDLTVDVYDEDGIS